MEKKNVSVCIDCKADKRYKPAFDAKDSCLEPCVSCDIFSKEKKDVK